MSRFGRRWRLVGGGLSNVWRFGDLDLSANSGRLLLRGPNGTGKTTALEALWPYLLDLDSARLAAGKARPTSLSSLMREGAAGKRRYGYAWMTLVDPAGAPNSFGVRLLYSDGGSPPVRIVPFVVPGRPLHDFSLWQSARAALSAEEFEELIVSRGGEVFEDEADYVSHLAARVFETDDVREIAVLAQRLRQIRNPSLLGDVSAQEAAKALRESLPGVSDETITATAEALEESKSTREAFEHDRMAADLLDDLAAAWSGHAVDVVTGAHGLATDAASAVRKARQQVKKLIGDLDRSIESVTNTQARITELEADIVARSAELAALEQREAYKEALLRDELASRLRAEQSSADAAARALRTIVLGLAEARRSIRNQLSNVIEDIDQHASDARAADPTLHGASSLISWTETQAGPLPIGDLFVDRGPILVIRGDAAVLRDVAATWEIRAREHKRQADSSALALIDHKPVAGAIEAGGQATEAASKAEEKADELSQHVRVARDSVVSAANTLRERLTSWCRTHPSLGGDLELDPLVHAEPAHVLALADEWASAVTTTAEGLAADFRAEAAREFTTATMVRSEASELRTRAAALRDGQLLPIPRPEWAGLGDDSSAFGAAVDWAPAAMDPSCRALVEASLSAAGVLGATLATDGLTSGTWHIDASGPIAPTHLGELLVVDPEHAAAHLVGAILERIELVPSAVAGPSATSVVIGRDGTFRAGVLLGRVPGAIDPTLLEAASHVGARQRRAAAVARAAALELQAGVLDQTAAASETRAQIAFDDASRVSEVGRSYPSRDQLRSVESRRAELDALSRNARDKAARARVEADSLVSIAVDLRDKWIARTSALGLPGDVVALGRMRDNGQAVCDRILRVARTLGSRLADRLQKLIEDQLRTEGTDVDHAIAEANAAIRILLETKTRLVVIEETMGAEIKEIMRRHDDATSTRDQLTKKLEPARTAYAGAIREQADARSKLDGANTNLSDAIPIAAGAVLSLRQLFDVPGVADATVDGAVLPSDEELLGFVQARVEGRTTRAKKTVRELADQARARLAGSWAVDPGEDHGELLTWALTHRDTTYSPPQAATHARRMKEHAERALAASEERALREFVIGRLPAAIGTAWTRLHDWVADVNLKMRSASASSGVGVQVKIPVLSDFSAHERIIYELSCKVSNAARTPDQERDLAAALHAVILGAAGDSMRDRVDLATDVRRWVDVHYEVTRGGGKTQRWGLRTGLSAGERRLVVLAPMLAAIAAQYDRFGERALRLVALDEVPAEVDERGRDGLARYIAQLDLDLICTSHQWDGCPGAWDGIDAHELEAGPDQTVVGFPMIVRGMGPLPGDPTWRLG